MRRYNLKFNLFLILNCILAFFPPAGGFNLAFAYTETTTGGQLSAEIFPEDPGAFTATSINLISYEIDLNSSNILWSINGVKQKSGIGQKSLQLTTGALGKKVLINIEALSPDGRDITKQISIIPAEVDLLWQSTNYVPPFYKGKALAGNQGTLMLLAVPSFIKESGQAINSSQLIYTWKLNSKELDSGIGKNKGLLNLDGNSYINNLFLNVTTADGSLKASKLITFSPIESKIILYQSSPLLGPNYSRALGDTLIMSLPETTIRVEPYFFNTSGLNYAWAINNGTPTASKSPELAIRQPNNNSGESILTVITGSTFQSAQKSINIKFNPAIGGF